MNNQNSIEQYRKKKKQKKLIRKIVLVLLALLIGAFAFWLVQDIAKSNSYDDQESPQFPINLKGEVPKDLNTVKDGLVVTTEGSVTFYSSLARKQNGFIHGYSRPVTQTAGGYAVTYDQGGYSVRVDTKNGNLGTLKMDNQILFCVINESGQVAIACEDQKYTNGVHIYESDLKEKLCSYYMNEYVMSLSFTEKNQCVIAAQTVSDGDFQTVLYGLDFSQNEELYQSTIDGVMTLSLGTKEENRLTLIGNHEVVFMEGDSTQLGQYDYQNQLAFFDNSEFEYLVMALKNTADPNKTDLMVFDTDGMLLAQTVVSGVVGDIFCDGQQIYVLDEDQIIQFDLQLEQKESWENNGGYEYLAVLNGTVYGMASDRLVQLS